MVMDTLLGFPSHTLPYRYRKYITLSTASNTLHAIGMQGIFLGESPCFCAKRRGCGRAFFAGYVDIGAHLCGGTRDWGVGSVQRRYACGFPEKTGGFGAGERYQLVGRSRKEHLTAPVSCARADIDDPVRLRWACPPGKTASAAAARCPRRCLRWSGRWHRWAFDPPPRRG